MKGFSIDVKNLNVTYKRKGSSSPAVKILQDINLNVQNSKMIAVVGSSGAGKTTLLNFLAGRNNVSKDLHFKGQLHINHKHIRDVELIKNLIGYVV